MYLRTMTQLRGDEVRSRDGPLGALYDIYFDGACGQVRYLVVAAGEGRRESRTLISVACLAGVVPVRGRVLVALSSAQLQLGAGAWPVKAASSWLDGARVLSGREVIGFCVEAEDGPAGRLADLLVDQDDWLIDYLVADVEHAAGSKRVLLPLDWVGAIDLEQRKVRVRRTREELHGSPPL